MWRIIALRHTARDTKAITASTAAIDIGFQSLSFHIRLDRCSKFDEDIETMAFSFRKTIKLFPGVKLNLSKSGISTTIGVPGATVNFGKKGTRATVGLPGTRISYSEKISGPATKATQHEEPAITGVVEGEGDGTWFLWFIAAVAVGMVIYGVLWAK